MMTIHNIIDIIEKNAEIFKILKDCPYEILKQWEIKDYAKGTVICNQGEVYDYFYIIVSGSVDVYIVAENGKKYSQAVYTRGYYIGELEIFDKKPYICSVQALSPVKILRLKREYFLKWIEIDKNINNYVMHTLCKQFYNLSKKAGEDTLYSLKNRVCNYLISVGYKNPNYKKNIIVNIEKKQLSEKFAVTQRSINRILQFLKEKNIIDVNNTCIIIKDMDELIKEEKKSRFE